MVEDNLFGPANIVILDVPKSIALDKPHEQNGIGRKEIPGTYFREELLQVDDGEGPSVRKPLDRIEMLAIREYAVENHGKSALLFGIIDDNGHLREGDVGQVPVVRMDLDWKGFRADEE